MYLINKKKTKTNKFKTRRGKGGEVSDCLYEVLTFSNMEVKYKVCYSNLGVLNHTTEYWIDVNFATVLPPT